jgi:hypothetical protein
MFRKIKQYFCTHKVQSLGEKCSKCGKEIGIWDLF